MKPAEVINPDGTAPLMLAVDHASNYLPDEFQDYDLPDGVLEDHVAVDIGARDLAVLLAEKLDAVCVAACFSRLVIDPNRAPDQPGLIPAVTDGVPIPFNQQITGEEAAWRLRLYHEPFHAALGVNLRKRRNASGGPFMIAGIHSFTPVMKAGGDRPWHVGLMYNRDGRLARLLRSALEEEDGLVIGWNEPYSGREFFYTMDRHGGGNGLPHVQIEVRQDLLQDKQGIKAWAGRLSRAFKYAGSELAKEE